MRILNAVLCFAMILTITGQAMAAERVIPSTKAQQEADQRMRRAIDMGRRADRKTQRLEADRLEAQIKAQEVHERTQAKVKALNKIEEKPEETGALDANDPYAKSDLVKQLAGPEEKPVVTPSDINKP